MPKRIVTGLVLLFLQTPARADAPGIYAESKMTVDGVTVRRIRDTSNGTVCYLATGPIFAGSSGTVRTGGAPAIACVLDIGSR